MANVNDVYSGDYMKATDVPTTGVKMQVESAGYDEKIKKIWIQFRGEKKRLVLNRTRAKKVSDVLGPDTDTWLGGWLEIQQQPVLYMGSSVPGIVVVRVASANGQQAKIAASEQQSLDAPPW